MTGPSCYVPRATGIAPADAQSMHPALGPSDGQTLHLDMMTEPPMSSWRTLSVPSVHTYPPTGAAHTRNTSTSSTSTVNDLLKLSATITDLIDEPLFLPAYLAGADYATSPILRTMSTTQVYSLPGAVSSIDHLELNFPELLAEEISFVDQQCNCAEAIRIVAHGPPKVVDMMRAGRPRSSRRASQMLFKRPTQRPMISPIQPSQIRSASISSVGTDSSMDRKTTSTEAPSPRTPPLESDDTPDTSDSEFGSPSLPTPKSSFEDQHKSIVYPVKEENIQPTPTKSPLHMKKPSRLALLLPKRTTSSISPRSAADMGKALPQIPPITPRTPGSARPTSFFLHMNSSKSKLMARGADEREPILEIPPIPKSSTYPPRSATSSTVPILKDPIVNRAKSKSVSRSHVIRRIESKMGLNSH